MTVLYWPAAQGVREPRYDPVSSHNGSVWPHDTAAATLSFEHYGLHAGAAQVVRALFDVARWAPDHRLSELLAGFPCDDGPPVPYPAACHPQGWDAAIPLALAHLLPEVSGPEAATPARQEWTPA
ncbi:hypothetical protein [Deinococcus sp. NW-56]|uniref:hypothetical protein n=1 Tax=Deinococcus sp. NW-56 TaxID=2080419 RepID=UPI001F39FBCB|nr:hypothetical protein [Deinococcus sp. NW-56]